MADGEDLRALALALEGTIGGPHFERRAFKVARIYATLDKDGLTANFSFTPDEQEFKVMLAPEAFAPVAGGWGNSGWTTVTLAALSREELAAALEMAWAHAQKKKR